MRPPPAHRATTAHLQALYPFVSDGGLPHNGPMIGRDIVGGPFCFDPWELYRLGVLTNPNVLVVGQIGRGKSTFVKTLVWREAAFGRRAWIVDPKGEYGPLAQACGSQPVVLRPGGTVRLNPLDFPGGGGSDEVVRRRVELIVSILAASLVRSLTPAERTAVELAVQHATRRGGPALLGDVVDALLEPDPVLARTVRADVAGLASDGRVVALELRRMVRGDLAGMFDGPTSNGIDLDAPVVTLDLSATFSTPALPLVMTCATAWLQSVGGGDSAKRVIVMDEAWAILAELAVARWAQASFKLARALGVANVVVVHRVSDLRAVGRNGSAEQKVAHGLVADAETKVVFGQSPSEAELTGRVLGLSATETALLSQLPRGVALWKVADRSFVVEHLVAPSERMLVYTDAAMTDPPPAEGAGAGLIDDVRARP